MKLVSHGLATFLFLALTALNSGEVCAATIQVPEDFPTIKEALLRANTGDYIEIAPGTYFESNLEMRHTVTLAGNGDGPADVVIDSNNQGRILWCESMIDASTIQKITFINGNASGETGYDQSGGAILISNSSPRILNCNFIDNSADASGGAIRCSSASPQIINCKFTNNRAGDGGGAIDCSYESSPLIRNCFFQNNRARWGGGLSCRGNASPIVYRANFDRNIAEGTNLGFGGAIFADFQAKPVFTESTFFGNEARYGGALACFEDSQTNLEHCTVLENSAIWMGGGMFCNDASPSITSSIFAFQDGTAITAAGAAIPQIENSDIFGNSGGDWIGAIANQAGGTNFFVDPLFCGYNPNIVFSFFLSEDSPLGTPNSDTVPLGAWPVGCSSLGSHDNFNVAWENHQPRITWSVSSHSSTMVFRLTRTIAIGDRAIVEIPYNEQSSGEFSALDAAISPVQGQQYLYSLYSLDSDGQWVMLEEAVLESELPTPATMDVDVFPNPFNPSTNIHFELDRAQHIKVSIFDIRGNKVASLHDAVLGTGSQSIPWNGFNDLGIRVGSGTYFVMIQAESTLLTEKIMMLK